MNPNTVTVPDRWHPQAVLDELKHLARGKRSVVEVGTWLGHSALAMAEVCDGRVYCVDHWRGSQNGTGLVDDPLAFYELFLMQIREYQAGDQIVPLFGDSTCIAQLFARKHIDLLYIDGAHDYDSVTADLRAWVPSVRAGGIVCGDDYSEVKKAVHDYFKPREVGIEVRANNRLWVVQL